MFWTDPNLFRPYRAARWGHLPRAAATLVELALPRPGLICLGPFGAIKPGSFYRSHLDSADVTNLIDEHGYVVIERALSHEMCDNVLREMGDVGTDERNQAGVRNALQRWSGVRKVATRSAIFEHVVAILGLHCFAVRAIFFDKTPGANWKVGWHQDLAIAVQSRHDVTGFGPWSIKAGVPHVRPPAAVLAAMLSARLHLDDCGPSNGPVRVVPGTHTLGVLDPSHRRVLHIEYACHDLPFPLKWKRSCAFAN